MLPTTPLQDTNSHTLSDDSYSLSSGHFFPSAPLSQLEIETKMTIANFNDTGELPDSIQPQCNILEDPSPQEQPLVSD